MVQWLFFDFLWRVALGLGAVLGLIAIIGLGIPQRKLRTMRPHVPD
jgi:hypothetical protein